MDAVNSEKSPFFMSGRGGVQHLSKVTQSGNVGAKIVHGLHGTVAPGTLLRECVYAAWLVPVSQVAFQICSDCFVTDESTRSCSFSPFPFPEYISSPSELFIVVI